MVDNMLVEEPSNNGLDVFVIIDSIIISCCAWSVGNEFLDSTRVQILFNFVLCTLATNCQIWWKLQQPFYELGLLGQMWEL